VVLVTVDTLRADHLGCYGYPLPTSPFLDRLAQRGVVLEHMYAPMSTTVPSHASLFTGLYPLQHRVLKNGHLLDQRFVTMAEVMQELGYETAAFTSTRHFRAARMSQGFQHFDEPDSYERPADQTTDALLQWLDARRSRGPLFLWVHLYDPHEPLTPPNRTLELMRSAAAHAPTFASFLLERHRIDPSFWDSSASMVNAITAYDAEIRFADEQLERLHTWMERRSQAKSALWAITADHGEGLGNHRWYNHGKHIYNEQIRVPFVLYAPSLRLRPSRIDAVVENLDVFPTLVELLAGDTRLNPTTNGVSLVPAIRGVDLAAANGFAFAQRREYDQRPARIDPLKTNYEDGEKYSLQVRSAKYILRTAGPDEFYRLDEDPFEERNLRETNGPAQADAMKTQLLAFIERLSDPTARESISVDPRALEELRSLGYVQ